MSETLVWAYKPLPALNNETGLVACDEELAKKLIASGDAQDTTIGAHHFKEIEAAPVAGEPAEDEKTEEEKNAEDYDTKVMSARKRKSKDEE